MDIIKWSPFQELDSKERQMRRAFERAGFAPSSFPPQTSTRPGTSS